MVARLDGPTAEIARNLVDKAMAAEADGLWGRAYFDLRGLTNGPYKMADDSMRSGSETCRRIGFETVVDYNGATLPANFPLSQVALYAGWYDVNVSGPFARPTVEFMPGAFAYHLHSFSAFTLRSTTRGWTGPLLAKGATATMGCVAEPYLIGTPDMGNFFLRFISGDSFGEAAYASQRFLSWETTVVGDPLYRPFGKAPRQQHEDLEQKHSKLIEWSYLRLTNYKLLNGTPRKEMIEQLESLQIARESAVLTEKLADLYLIEGNAAASVTNLQESLKLGPTPQQRVRIMLALADRLISLQRNEEAYLVYQQFLKEVPDYADELFIYRRLLDLAQKLGKKDDADKFEHQVSHLAAPSQPPKGPPIRHGI
jgi:tetratricopeptide (TPR) repeat protein